MIRSCHSLQHLIQITLAFIKKFINNLKKLLTKAEYGEVLSGTFNCSDKRCE